MVIQVEEAAPSAYAQLYAIFQEAGPDRPHALERGFLLSRYDEAGFAAFLEERSVFYALIEEAAAGFVVAEPIRFSALPDIVWIDAAHAPRMLATTPLSWIRMLAVAPYFERRGVGTALYRHIFSTWNDAGLLTGLYEAPLDNRASRAFHRRLGFRRVGENRRHHPGEDAPRRSGIYYRPPRTNGPHL